MYLMDQAAPPINNRKWNLGRLRLGCAMKPNLGLLPVRLPNLGTSFSTQPWRRLRGLGRLGQSVGPTSDYCVYYADDGVTPQEYDYGSNPVECASNGGSWFGAAPLNTPTPVGTQNPSPVTGGASNGGITTVPATTPSKSPLDYTSPQAAIAAGLPAAQVMATWSAALARYPSPQAAIAAGIPAGVVNQLWQQSNVNAANAAAASAASSSSLTTLAMYGIGGIVLLSVLGGKGRR